MFNIRVPETILCFLVAQTVSGVWWASSQTTKTEQIQRDIAELKTSYYPRSEAVLALQNVANSQADIDKRVTRLEDGVVRSVTRGFQITPESSLNRAIKQDREDLQRSLNK